MLSARDLGARRHAGMAIVDKFGIRLMYRREATLRLVLLRRPM